MGALIADKIRLPNGEVLHYRVKQGGSEVLILIHGNMTSSLFWDVFMEKLPDCITAYAVDLRGFGDSTYCTPIQTIKDLSDDIKLFVDALELSDFTIIGWSLGGAVAMQYAVDFSADAKKLILLNSSNIKGFPIPKRNIMKLPVKNEFLQSKEEVAKVFRIIEKIKVKRNKWLLKFLMNRFLYAHNKPDEERYERYIKETMKQRNLIDVSYALMNFNISSEFNGVTEGTGQAEQIDIPVIVIQGDEDKLISVKDALEIAQGIGKNAELKILKKCGHCPFFDALDKLNEICQ